MIKRISFLALFSAMLLWACSGGTKITDSWSNEALTPVKYKKIAVVGVTSRLQSRKVVELEMEDKLDSKGINAIGALDFLPPNATKDNITQEVFFEFLNIEKIEAVIMISVLSRAKQTNVMVTGYVWVPQYGMPLTDYYGQMSNYVYQPLYYSQTDVVYLECALYSYPEGKMIWAAQSKTIPLYNLEETASQYADVIVRDMIKKKVFVIEE